MKKGESIKFKKVKWVLIQKKNYYPTMIEYWTYKVYRKYFYIWLRNTNKEYEIFPNRWERMKKKVKKNSIFYPSQLSYF